MTLNEALSLERARPGSRTLTLGQCHQLDTFTKRWNESRKARGLHAVSADTALSEGLRALTELVTDGLKATRS